MSQFKKENIEKKILKAAKAVFLQKGYLGASLREIVKRGGITLSNLYNYYMDKNALFLAVLKPELDDLERLCEYGRSYQSQDGPFQSLQEKQANMLIALNYIDAHRRELNLLFNQATGSSLEKYSDYLAGEYEKNWERFFRILNEKFPDKKFKKPSSFFLRNMTHFHFMTVGQILANNLSRDEMSQIADELALFFWHGGMGLMESANLK